MIEINLNTTLQFLHLRAQNPEAHHRSNTNAALHIFCVICNLGIGRTLPKNGGIMMQILITGISGFIGRHLSRNLLQAGYTVTGLSRNPGAALRILPQKVRVLSWDGHTADNWIDHLTGPYAIINLAGENLASGRWTAKRKRRIRNSRMWAGDAIQDAIHRADHPPESILQASGVGYYGTASTRSVDEYDAMGTGFLAELAYDWERTTIPPDGSGIRHIVLRSGVVLGDDGGALSHLLAPFRFHAGGVIGNGRQSWPWIHISDQAAAILHLLTHSELDGAFNLVAPEPATMTEFAHLTSQLLHRRAWLPIPAPLLRLALGEMANEMLLQGVRAFPRHLLDSGFSFRYPTLQSALENLLLKPFA